MTEQTFKTTTIALLVVIITMLMTGCSTFDSRNSGGKNWGAVSYSAGKVIDNGGSTPRSDIRH